MKKTELKKAGKGVERKPFKSKPKPSLKRSEIKRRKASAPKPRVQSEVKKRKHNIKRNKTRKKSSSSPLSREIKLCDLAFSKYIRLLDCPPNGIVKCFTCEYQAYYQKAGIQCGHFISRGSKTTRWMRLNCEKQCIQCNEHLSGNLKVFEQRLIEKHGKGIIEYLKAESNKISKLTTEKVKNLRIHFESEVAKLKSTLTT